MKKMIIAQTLLILGCKVNVGTNENEQFKVIPYTDKVSFNDFSQYVLTPHCVSCHVWALDEVAVTQRMIAGDPENSVIYNRILSGSMPPNSGLSPKEIDLVERFIKSAKNEQAQSPQGTQKEPTSQKIPPSVIVLNSTYKSIYHHLIETSCLSCHNNASEEISFEGHSNLKKHASEIIDILDIGEMEGTPMPPYDNSGKRMAPVPTEQVIESFRAWITEGKLEN